MSDKQPRLTCHSEPAGEESRRSQNNRPRLRRCLASLDMTPHMLVVLDRGCTRRSTGVSLLNAGVAAVDEEHEQDDQPVEDLLPGRFDADDLQYVLHEN